MMKLLHSCGGFQTDAILAGACQVSKAARVCSSTVPMSLLPFMNEGA